MAARDFRLSAYVVDLFEERVYPACLEVADGRIAAVRETRERPATFVLPGFVDAHVHVESSMLTPQEFARVAVTHGTVATVSDPHEIANVLGMEGVRYMLACAGEVPFKFFFGAPSCVPATPFESAGGALSVADVVALLDDPRILYLSEVMNVAGVLRKDPEVLSKIAAAQQRGKRIDGHAPGVVGEDAARYFAAGIETDHECVTYEEALEKLSLGVTIQLREGSAARNFDSLVGLLREHSDRCMLCSDDMHPDDLLAGHLNLLARRAVAAGIPALRVLRAACRNPVEHYGLDVGLLRPGDPADFIEVRDLEGFEILRTYLRGELVAEGGRSCLPRVRPTVIQRFAATPKRPEDFRVPAGGELLRVMEVIEGQLITHQGLVETPVEGGLVVTDVERDTLKIAVVNRYQERPPAVGFVRNFGLRSGAVASSVAHDSHNIVAVGVSDSALCSAVQLVIEARGGLAVVGEGVEEVLPLPIAGLMSTDECAVVAAAYGRLNDLARSLGTPLAAPLMTLSFLALPVIPSLKMTDRGMFDAERFEFVSLFESAAGYTRP